VVEVDHVSKVFHLDSTRGMSVKERMVRRREQRNGQDFWALRDVFLELDEGSTLGLMGHNGSGKSTLLKLIGGILKPTEGTVKVRGRIASLLELGAGMHPELTGRENVYMNGAILGMPKAELRRRFDDIVSFAELEQFIDQQVKHYSSGMFVRLGFSVAVNVEPDVLLVDEVLAVGDENFQRKCLERVRRFQRQGRTIIVVSHSADQIRQICDLVAVLDHGEVVAFDEPAKAIRVFREHLLDDELERRARAEVETNETDKDGSSTDAGDQPSLAAEESLDESSAYRAHGSRQEAKRNLRIRIRSLDIDYAAKPERRYLLPGERVTFRVQYHTDYEIDDAVFGISIYDHATGRFLFGTNTNILGLDLGTLSGDGEVAFEVTSVPLLDGTYPVTVGIHSKDEATVYDWREQQAWFEVLSPDRTSGLVWMAIEASTEPTG
jgi:ABC-type polysaccharide/polyol phosphate transport system ATPase subunit